MSRQKPRIVSIEALLELLYVSQDDRTKTSATLFANNTTRYVLGSLDDPSDFFVREHFDNGSAQIGAFSKKDCAVEEVVFQKAHSLGYIRGKLEPGRVSDTEFVLSDLGTHVHLQNFFKSKQDAQEPPV